MLIPANDWNLFKDFISFSKEFEKKKNLSTVDHQPLYQTAVEMQSIERRELQFREEIGIYQLGKVPETYFHPFNIRVYFDYSRNFISDRNKETKTPEKILIVSE